MKRNLSGEMNKVLDKQIPTPALETNSRDSFDRQGRLSDQSSRQIIEELHLQRFSGTLALKLKDKKKKIWFYNGEVFRIQSNMVPELIGKMMVDRSWLTEADLQTCLKIQKDLIQQQGSSRRIGDLVHEIHDVDADEVASLLNQQYVYSFLQAMTWNSGEFEVRSIDFSKPQNVLFRYDQVIGAVKSLFEVESKSQTSLFDTMDPWHPDNRGVDLSQTPLWSVLAGARRYSLSGIISVRRQNRLYEVVVKYGIPLTLYEGTFGQPRQTIVVRQASEEHERYFIEQLFKLFSFLTGSAHFRSIQDHAGRSTAEKEAHLQFKEEATGITKSVKPDDVPFELRPSLIRKSSKFMRLLKGLKERCVRLLSKWRVSLLRRTRMMLESAQKSLPK